MDRICDHCNIEKSDFKNDKSTVCDQCKKEKIELKREEYRNTNLGVEALDLTLKKYNRLLYKLNYADTVSLGKVYEHLERGEVNVISSDTIYVFKNIGKNPVLNSRKKRHKRVVASSNNICHYCGDYGDTVDHVIPRHHGGSDQEDNLVCSCVECNGEKGLMSYERFLNSDYLLRVKELQKRHELRTIHTNNLIFKHIEEHAKIKSGNSLDDMLNALNNKNKWN